MRDLRRNRQQIFYAQYIGDVPILDADGYDTGETAPGYSAPMEAWLNQAPASGEAVNQVFGDFKDYSKVLCTAREFPFTEETVVWVDKQPQDPPAVPPEHDYVVKRVAKSLNGWMYALQAVNVSG